MNRRPLLRLGVCLALTASWLTGAQLAHADPDQPPRDGVPCPDHVHCAEGVWGEENGARLLDCTCDEAGRLIAREQYEASNRLFKSIEYQYDAQDRVALESRKFRTADEADTYEYQYDGFDRVVVMTRGPARDGHPYRSRSTYTHDAQGELTQEVVVDWDIHGFPRTTTHAWVDGVRGRGIEAYAPDVAEQRDDKIRWDSGRRDRQTWIQWSLFAAVFAVLLAVAAAGIAMAFRVPRVAAAGFMLSAVAATVIAALVWVPALMIAALALGVGIPDENAGEAMLLMLTWSIPVALAIALVQGLVAAAIAIARKR
jgi:hypothetical protein